MLKRHIKYILLLFVITLLSNEYAYATHIIGGELTYSCLGNNKYQISLTVYRDCYTGRPPFDDPAYIGIFDNQNNLLDSVKLKRQKVIKLDPKLSDTCLVVPPDVCVQTTTYLDTITLPFRTGGYVLAYQRCCRNATILNIIKPLDAGATFMIAITEEAISQCNSSAKFKEWPPIYICVNKPINFDQSAIDIDGDSVYYKLCTPLLGGTSTLPQPMPANPPPYDMVEWKSPYGLNNILGGDPLVIDPKRGFLSGTPNTIGQFVVGICIEEFRKGKLISTTRRDFQFNVGVCGNSVASIFAPKVICDEYTVFFENKSLNSNKYEWDFGDPNANPIDTSFKKEPTWVYADTGTYIIRLITQPKSACADTSFHTLKIKNSAINPYFITEKKGCEDSLILACFDKSVDTLGKKIKGYQWEVYPAFNFNDTLRSTLKDPVFALKRPGIWKVRLTVIGENDCPKVVEQEVTADLIELNLPDTLRDCQGRTVALNPNSDPTLKYDWQPAADFKDPTAAQQSVVVGASAKKYTVILKNGTCSKKENIYVLKDDKAPTVTVTVDPDTIFFGKNTQLKATIYPTTYKYTWTPSSGLSNTNISNPFAAPSVTTTYTVNVKAPNSTCEGTAQARVYVIVPDCDEPYVFLPNAFTPNDDGINDILQVRGSVVSDVRLLIYNRWGEKVFESEGSTGGWDGYFGSTLCPPDVYGFYLEATCIGGGKYIKKGNINLIR